LQDSLSRADALSLSGRGTSLHFLTRETADDEKQGLQREVSKLKKTIKERDKAIDDKDIHIKGLDEQSKILSFSFRGLKLLSSFQQCRFFVQT
jgi:hypothetical protein